MAALVTQGLEKRQHLYQIHCADTSAVPSCMDTVIGRIGGKALLTLTFTRYNFMIGNYITR